MDGSKWRFDIEGRGYLPSVPVINGDSANFVVERGF